MLIGREWGVGSGEWGAQISTPSRGVDEQSLHGVAHSKSRYNEQRREGAHTKYANSLSSAPGVGNKGIREIRGEVSPLAPDLRSSAPPLSGGHPRNAPVFYSLLSDPHSPLPTPHSPLFSLYTLGCKLNQLESEAIVDAFKKAGFSLVQGTEIPGPGLIIINTCTVTSKADQKCRRMIRKMLRDNPDACVIVTGCYARLDADALNALEADAAAGDRSVRRLFVLGGESAAKSALLDLPEYLRKTAQLYDGVSDSRYDNLSHAALPEILESWIQQAQGNAPFRFMPEEFTFHSRGYLKIQDGCDHHCTYCRVRLARGPSVSLPKEAALAQLRSFEARGCAELMLTGVNITQYDHSGAGLAGLLEYLLEGSSTIALRLASLEPERVDERLVAVLAHPRIRPHFHLSVQSGSDVILKKMGRAYDSRTVERCAALLRSVKDNPFFACDIIAGFPGEGADEFAQTLALCEQISFAWIHAFPYSKRPGTAAFAATNAVCEREVSQRVQALTDMALRNRQRYAQYWIDRELSAVVEKDKPGNAEQYCRAVSENYLKLLVHGGKRGELPPAGSAIRCIPESLCAGADGEAPDAVAGLVSNF